MSNAPRTVEIGPQRLPGVYFLPSRAPLPAWLDPSTVAVPRGATNRAAYLVTDDVAGADPIRKALLDAIGRASWKVLFCSFLFADPAIVDALVEAAERLQGGVYVLTALSTSLRVATGELDDDLLDLPAQRREQKERDRRDRHFAHLDRLARAGVWLRSASDSHAKLCVVDDEIAVVTSANATPEAYEDNPENGLLIEDPDVARELGRLFAHAWIHFTDHESPPGVLDLKERGKRPAPPPWRRLAGHEPLWPIATLRREETSIRDATLALLRGARHELVIASYSAIALRDHAVGQALREAALEREVRVLLVLRPNNLRADQVDACSFLFDGIPQDRWVLCGHERTHAKAIVADGERALLWTGNLDGKVGYDDGIEVGVMVTDRAIATAARDHVLDIAQRAGWRGVLAPTLGEVATSVRRRLDGAWTLALPPNIRPGPAALARELGRGLVHYAELDREMVALRAGEFEIYARRDEAQRRLTVERIATAPQAVARMEGLVGGCTLTFEERSAAAAPSKADAPRRRGGRRR
ncbi:phospholipase D-like domain-containing protein [Sorangium sp. So ce385]|uniref:phospholipase D-like domain-containing protein n=1 Tax=Sorangium sp. So ce385 TaxID=3133308 RepID=UPI003F5C4FFE